MHLGSYVRTYPYTPAPVDATHRNFLCAFAHGSFYRMQESLCVAITTTVPHSVCDWALLTVKTVNCWHNDMQDSATTMFMKCKMAGIKSLNAVLRCAKILCQDFPCSPNGRPLHIRGDFGSVRQHYGSPPWFNRGAHVCAIKAILGESLWLQ